MSLHPATVSLHLFDWMPLLAHAPSDAMVWFGSLHLLSVPLAVLSVFLLGWPGRRKLTGIIAAVALLMSLPVLVVFPFLPALLGSAGEAGFIMLLLLVAPSLSMFVLFLLKRWSKTGGGGRRSPALTKCHSCLARCHAGQRAPRDVYGPGQSDC